MTEERGARARYWLRSATASLLVLVMSVTCLGGVRAGVPPPIDYDPDVNLTVTVQVNEVIEMDPVDSDSDADFYWKVYIAGTTITTAEPYATNDWYVCPSTPWRATVDVPDNIALVTISIQLWDDDGSGDDICDISKDAGGGDKNYMSQNIVDITYDLSKGTWSGDDGGTTDANGVGHVSGNEDGSCYLGNPSSPGVDPDQNDCDMFFTIYQNEYDGDGIVYWQEKNTYGTNSRSYDTDGDGISDREALYMPQLNPLAWNDPNADPDGDKCSNRQEVDTMKTDPRSSDRWALIVNGGSSNPSDPTNDDLENGAIEAYVKVLGRGYTAAQAVFMFDYYYYDQNGDGKTEVDYVASRGMIVAWLHSVATADDRLFIYMDGHGSQSGYYMVRGQNVYSYDLGLMLLRFNNNMIFVLEACYSGSFLTAVEGISPQQRIAISSSDATHVSCPDTLVPNYPAFSHKFWTALGASGTAVESAFATADVYIDTHPDAAIRAQNPQMRDWIPNNTQP